MKRLIVANRPIFSLLALLIVCLVLASGCRLPDTSGPNPSLPPSTTEPETLETTEQASNDATTESEAIAETESEEMAETATDETESTGTLTATESITSSQPVTASQTVSPAQPEPAQPEPAQSEPASQSIANLVAISQIDWSPDGQWLAVSGSASQDQGALVIYRYPDLSAPLWQQSSALPNGPESVVISANGQLVAAITSSNAVALWDTNNGAVIGNFSYGEFAPVTSIAFSPSGDRLAIGGAVGPAGLVKVIDLATQTELFNIPYDQPFMQLSFQPNGQLLSGAVSHSCGPGAAYAFTVDLNSDPTDFDWRRDVEIQHPRHQQYQGTKMLTVGAYGQRCQFYVGDIQMVDTETKAITGNVVRLAAVPTAYLSADGSAFVIDDGIRMEVWRDEPLRRVRVLDPTMGKPLAISPDGILVAQANGNVITFVATGGTDAPAVAIASDTPIQVVEDFAPLDPAAIEARYQRMEIPDGLLSITKASQSDPAILTFVVDQAAIDKYLMAVHEFESIQDWTGARYIEIDVRNGPEQSPLMIQLREKHVDGRQGDSWRGSRAVPPYSEMTVSILLEASKGFNPIPTAPAGDGVLDLNAIGTIELGVTSHHVMRGQMEILAIRLFD